MSAFENHDINEFNQPIGRYLPDWSGPDHPEREALEGRFCRVEPLDGGKHAHELFENLNDDVQSWTYLPGGPYSNEEVFRAWIEDCCNSKDPQFYAITRQPGGEAVGMASYLRFLPDSGSIEVGNILFSDLLKRTPAATEAMFLMMQNVFELGYRRYEWKSDALNAPSRAAAQRFGFSFEGIFRQATVYKHRNRDTAWYAIIDREWPALRSAYTRWLAPDNFDENGHQKSALRELTAPLLFKKG